MKFSSTALSMITMMMLSSSSAFQTPTNVRSNIGQRLLHPSTTSLSQLGSNIEEDIARIKAEEIAMANKITQMENLLQLPSCPDCTFQERIDHLESYAKSKGFASVTAAVQSAAAGVGAGGASGGYNYGTPPPAASYAAPAVARSSNNEPSPFGGSLSSQFGRNKDGAFKAYGPSTDGQLWSSTGYVSSSSSYGGGSAGRTSGNVEGAPSPFGGTLSSDFGRQQSGRSDFDAYGPSTIKRAQTEGANQSSINQNMFALQQQQQQQQQQYQQQLQQQGFYGNPKTTGEILGGEGDFYGGRNAGFDPNSRGSQPNQPVPVRRIDSVESTSAVSKEARSYQQQQVRAEPTQPIMRRPEEWIHGRYKQDYGDYKQLTPEQQQAQQYVNQLAQQGMLSPSQSGLRQIDRTTNAISHEQQTLDATFQAKSQQQQQDFQQAMQLLEQQQQQLLQQQPAAPAAAAPAAGQPQFPPQQGQGQPQFPPPQQQQQGNVAFRLEQ